MKQDASLTHGLPDAPWRCLTCGSGYAEYVNGCPHCWEAGIRSKVERVPEVPGPGRWE